MPPAEQATTLARAARELAEQAQGALTEATVGYGQQRRTARIGRQQRAAALAAIVEAAGGTAVRDDELAALATAARTEDDANYTATRSDLRRLEDHHIGTLRVLAVHLAALGRHLDDLAGAIETSADARCEVPEDGAPPDGHAS